MPTALSPLLHRARTGILMLLLVVLPLQSMVQLSAGMQAQRHWHTGAAEASAPRSLWLLLAQPLRAVLTQLHAAQDPRASVPSLRWRVGGGPLAGRHQHGGVFHTHTAATHDVVAVADAADDSLQNGATAFLAWIPRPPPVMAATVRQEPPVGLAAGWRDRLVPPPLMPPRA